MYKYIFSTIEIFLLIFSLYNSLEYGDDSFNLSLSIFCLYISGIFASTLVRGNVSFALVQAYRHYVALAVYSKVIILSNHPELVLGSLLRFDTAIFENSISEVVGLFFVFSIFVYLCICVCDFLIDSLIYNAKNVSNHTICIPNNFNLIVFFCVLMKIFLSSALDLAKPGVLPVEIPIPMLTGFLNNFCIHVVLILCTLLIVCKNEKPILKYIPVLLNLSVDVANGYKFSIITTCIVLCVFYLRGQNLNLVRLVSKNLILSFVALFLVAMYPVLDLYSDLKASLGSVNLLALIELATEEFSDVVLYLPIAEIVRRINGIDTYIMMSFYSGGNSVPVSYIFDSSMIQLINDGMYGRNSGNVVTAAGSTIFLPLYLSSGLLVGAAILFFLLLPVVLLMSMSECFLLKTAVLRRLFIAFMCVEFIRYVFSAGDYLNNFKLTVMYLLTFIVIQKFIDSKRFSNA